MSGHFVEGTGVIAIVTCSKVQPNKLPHKLVVKPTSLRMAVTYKGFDLKKWYAEYLLYFVLSKTSSLSTAHFPLIHMCIDSFRMPFFGNWYSMSCSLGNLNVVLRLSTASFMCFSS